MNTPDPLAFAAVAGHAEALRHAGPDGLHVPAADAHRLGDLLAGAEEPGAFHRGIRVGEAQMRVTFAPLLAAAREWARCVETGRGAEPDGVAANAALLHAVHGHDLAGAPGA